MQELVIPKTQGEILLKFRAKKDWFVYKLLHIINGDLYATDGSRLLKVSKDSFSFPEGGDGAYILESLKKDKGFLHWFVRPAEGVDKLPVEVENVFPESTTAVFMALIDNSSLSLTRELLNIYSKTGRAIQYKYLKDLSIKDPIAWDVRVDTKKERDANSPIILEAKERSLTAIISPFKLEL